MFIILCVVYVNLHGVCVPPIILHANIFLSLETVAEQSGGEQLPAKVNNESEICCSFKIL